MEEKPIPMYDRVEFMTDAQVDAFLDIKELRAQRLERLASLGLNVAEQARQARAEVEQVKERRAARRQR